MRRRGFIHKMSPDDLDQILEMEAPSPSPWSRDMFLQEMSLPLAHCFSLRIEETPESPIIGFVCFRMVGDESELLKICVHPDHGRAGWGRRLMAFHLAYCRSRGIKTSFLEVSRNNDPALRLYKRFGYRRIGTRPNFYEGTVDAFLMVRAL